MDSYQKKQKSDSPEPRVNSVPPPVYLSSTSSSRPDFISEVCIYNVTQLKNYSHVYVKHMCCQFCRNCDSHQCRNLVMNVCIISYIVHKKKKDVYIIIYIFNIKKILSRGHVLLLISNTFLQHVNNYFESSIT